MDYQSILHIIEEKVNTSSLDGKVATYIPELAKINPGKLGMHLSSVIGQEFSFGDSQERFSIQSISKVLSLTLALLHEGESIWERVDVEPSGDPFNSLVQLEHEEGIPRNPLINSGALVICDMLVSHLQNPLEEYLEFVRKVAGNNEINYNKKVAESEKAGGHHKHHSDQ